MTKAVTAVFKLTEKEIREALYDFYVRKLKANNINAMFSETSIDIFDMPDVSLTITEEKDIE